MESTLDHQNVHKTCVIVSMMTDNDGNVDDDGYDCYDLDLKGRSKSLYVYTELQIQHFLDSNSIFYCIYSS